MIAVEWRFFRNEIPDETLSFCSWNALVLPFEFIMTDLETYYRSHRHRVYGYLVRLSGDAELAADVTQEAFLRYASRYGSDTIEPALLYRIARNLAMDFLRKSRRSCELIEPCADDGNDPESAMVIQEEFRRMLVALQRMNAEDREILALVSSDEALRYRDIAAILGISEGNARIRVHRARIRLREAMK